MTKLLEFSTFEGTADDTNVFRNVKVLGKKSLNGYEYDAKAIEKATHLYEGASVFVDHGKGARSYRDRIGYISNPTAIDGEIHGDFILNPKHPLAEQVLWDAQHNSKQVGFSHSIDGNLNKKTNIVESIDKVYSVDLVANPATTKSLFEQEQAEVQEQHQELAAIKETIEALKKSNEQLAAQVATLTKIKPVAIAPSAPAPAKDSYADWLTKMRS